MNLTLSVEGHIRKDKTEKGQRALGFDSGDLRLGPALTLKYVI